MSGCKLRFFRSSAEKPGSDARLVTVLTCLYVISLVDRVNISTAAIAGLNTDLQLQVGTRYSIS